MIGATLSKPSEVRQLIEEERKYGASARNFEAHARDCANLAERYEADARIFPGQRLGIEGERKSKALRKSERLLLRAAKVAAKEEAAETAAREEQDRVRHEAYMSDPQRKIEAESVQRWLRGQGRGR